MLLGGALAAAMPAASAAAVISELSAANEGLLRDADGDSPDWIELHNLGPEPLNLAGWRLTDDPNDPERWVFPETILPPDGYLVVFASGKNRAAPGAELHTNFRLDPGGEFLALIRPDGTVEHAYAPTFPPQRANTSYGLGEEFLRTNLVAADAPVRFFAPRDASLGVNWQDAWFDDRAWPGGSMPLGYDASGGGDGVPILSLDFNDDDSGESGVDNTEPDFRTMTLAENPAVFDGISVSLEALGGAVLDDRDRAAPKERPPQFVQDQLYDDFLFANGTFDGAGLRIRIEGLAPRAEYRLTLWSFDTGSVGERVSDWIAIADGATNILASGYTFDGAVLPERDGDDTITALVVSSSTGAIQIEGRRRGGRSHGVFVNALRLEQLGYRSVIQTDVEEALRGRNASLYVRLPFRVEDPADWDALVIRARYDDGFAAYLNGRLVAARGAPPALSWNSAATEARSVAEALAPEEILIRPAGEWLEPGRNILAVQALNVAPDDENFLFGVEVEARSERSLGGRFFEPPTPGAPNGAGYAGWLAPPRAVPGSGFYEQPFEAALIAPDPQAQIRWTTNGSPPSLAESRPYTGPIPVAGTTILRAAAYREGFLPSRPAMWSYIFLDQVLRQPDQLPGYPEVWQAGYPADYGMDPNVVEDPRYSPELKEDLRAIPTLSIAADHEGLWGASKGIYNHATESGAAWERPASVELIAPDGSTLFQADCGLRMQGHASRDNVRTPKHSFRLIFRGRYGLAKLRRRQFPDSAVEAFDNLVLRACFTDAWTTRYSPPSGDLPRGARYRPEDSLYLRDVWMKDSQLAMGGHSAHNTFVHLYLNGLYWGLYNVSERLDASHFAQYFGGREEDWDVIRDFHEVLDGSGADWDALMKRLNAGIHSEADYQAVCDLVDVDNLIDYMILHIYAEAEDWPHHNWYAAHRRAGGGLPATKWIFAVWDQEIVCDRLYRRDRVDVSNDRTPARIYAKLREWPEFRRRFGDRLHQLLFHGGALCASNAAARLRARAAQIERAIVGESARWGDARENPVPPNPGTGKTFTRDEWWRPELEALCSEWFPGQAALTIERFRRVGLYPSAGAPDFQPFGGPVPAGFRLTISDTNREGRVYYTLNGPDPRVYGAGEIAPEARAYAEPIPIERPTRVRARTLVGSEWSALVEAVFYPPRNLSGLALSEIMYHPKEGSGDDSDQSEFLELQNAGGAELDLSGLQFVAGVRFVFPFGATLPPGGFLVLAKDPQAFAARYPGAPLSGVYEGSLSNGGERLTLSEPSGTPVWSVIYDDKAPWPEEADGEGLSLQRRDPADPDLGPAAWVAAAPTPGRGFETADTDGDGLPDAWELAFGLDPRKPGDAGRDSDEDGLANREEFIAGTDPRDPQSVLALHWKPAAEGDRLLWFEARPGVRYVLEAAESLRLGAWRAEAEWAPAAAGRILTLPLDPAAGPRRFYRLRAER